MPKEGVEPSWCQAPLDFALVRAAYEKSTRNRWTRSASEASDIKGTGKVPADRIISVLESVARRIPARINSFNYFVKEIAALPDPRNRPWQKKQIEKIVRRIRDNSVGRAGYSEIDYLEDVKCACAREVLPIDNDIFNEMVS